MIKKFNEFQSSKNVIVFHGLGGSPSQDRIDVLKGLGYNVIYPHIDFEREWFKDKGKSLFNKSISQSINCDLIIGMSLGGYLANLIANELNINCILINPALDRSKTKLEIKDFDCPHSFNNCKLEIFIGNKDILIPKEITLNYIEENNINCDVQIIENMEHRCSPDNFNEILNKSKFI